MRLLAGEFGLRVGVAVYAHCRIASDSGSIPMQWSLSGNVNWAAPRLLAFALVPMLVVTVMLLLISGDRRAVGT
jgi:hypothetical protein